MITDHHRPPCYWCHTPFIPTSQTLEQQSDDPLKKLRDQSKGMVTCRICKGDHWTSKCPYKDSLGVTAMKELEEQGTMVPIHNVPVRS